MFTVRLSDMVATVKEAVIPRGQRNPKALHLCFDVGLKVWDPIVLRQRHTSVHFLLYCPYGGAVHTFVAESDLGIGVDSLSLEWENTSNHDSCWRSDGIDAPVTDIYNRMYKELRAELDRVATEPNMCQDYHINTFCGGSVIHLVDVNLSENSRGYHIEIL